MATILDFAVWYYVKDLVIFDKKDKGGEEEENVGEKGKGDSRKAATKDAEAKHKN